MGNQTTINFGGAGDPGFDTSAIPGTAAQNSAGTKGRSPMERGLIDPSPYTFGVPMAMTRPFIIQPLTLQTNNIATAAIVTSAITLAAGTGVTATTIVVNGVTKSVLDLRGQGTAALTSGDLQHLVQRSVRVVGATNVVSTTITLSGYDMYLKPVTCAFAGPTGAATTESNKTFAYLETATTSATTVAAISLGTGDTFGFPIAVYSWADIMGGSWNGVNFVDSTGFTAADTTNPTTTTTTDVRGSYTVQTTASNGTRKLGLNLFLNNPNNLQIAYGLLP